MSNNLSASRQGFAPKLDHTHCTNCGICDVVCPDYCFAWEADNTANGSKLLGIDYRYCKGCLRCIESCPSGALTKEKEGPWVDKDQVFLWQKSPK